MGFLEGIIKKTGYDKKRLKTGEDGTPCEYCPRCDGILFFQKGYSNDLPYWICKGCGEMLINPELETEDDIAWICDQCSAMLNIQEGFTVTEGEWTCRECGFVNRIGEGELYASEDEFMADQRNPYKGLSDEDLLALSLYEEVRYIEGRSDVILVKNRESGKFFIKKLIITYNRSIYDHLKDNPVEHMPVIYEIYEGRNCLIVIEEFVEGRTVADILDEGVIAKGEAVRIAIKVCRILEALHKQERPIIHRDIKPSNIMVTEDNEVYLLDMNVAKWYDPDKSDDTRYMGTRFYAAPEQVGYGLSASSEKSDIYALGILLNVMITGKFPKEERAGGRIFDIIEGCIKLDAGERFDTGELIDELEGISEEL
ncbi:MAG: protein kinase [Lachnospiraceae bacterium]|nr:protein kinase [Lachnospiraceae bacterium]